MTYNVIVERRATKALRNLSSAEYERVAATLRGLAANPRPVGVKKLVGRDGWRVRVGQTRIIYDIDDAAHTVRVTNIGHRSDVYR